MAKTYGTRAYDVGRLAAPTKEQWPTVGKRIVPGYPFLEAEVISSSYIPLLASYTLPTSFDILIFHVG